MAAVICPERIVIQPISVGREHLRDHVFVKVSEICREFIIQQFLIHDVLFKGFVFKHERLLFTALWVEKQAAHHYGESPVFSKMRKSGGAGFL